MALFERDDLNARSLISHICFLRNDKSAEQVVVNAQEDTLASSYIADLLIKRERFRLACSGFCSRYLDAVFGDCKPREQSWSLIIGSSCGNSAGKVEKGRFPDPDILYVEVDFDPDMLVLLGYKERNTALYEIVEQAFFRLEDTFAIDLVRTRSIFARAKDNLIFAVDTDGGNLLCSSYLSDEGGLIDASTAYIHCNSEELAVLKAAVESLLVVVEQKKAASLDTREVLNEQIRIGDKSIDFIITD